MSFMEVTLDDAQVYAAGTMFKPAAQGPGVQMWGTCVEGSARPCGDRGRLKPYPASPSK